MQKILAALASEIADLVIRLGEAQAENAALRQQLAESGRETRPAT